VTIVNPDHLFDQAEGLVKLSAAGPPRQADLRRAISTAYYGLFHATLRATADLFVGTSSRNSTNYALVYRSVDHKRLRDFCEDVLKQTMPKKYSAYVPRNGFGPNIAAFAAAFIELQNKRVDADYNPLYRTTKSNARLLVRTARAAAIRFKKASSIRRRAFLTLLVFPPRPQQ
jgi:hypothetical protein